MMDRHGPGMRSLRGHVLACAIWCLTPGMGLAQTSPTIVPATPGAVPGLPMGASPGPATAQRGVIAAPAPALLGADNPNAATPTGSISNQAQRLGAPDSTFQQPSATAQGNEPDAGTTPGASQRRTAYRVPLEITEFQKFVSEATGQRLALFGYSLFASDPFRPSQELPAPADYVIGSGDVIQLHVWGAVDADLRLTVDRNGQVAIPKAGTVNVAGVRASQLETVLAAHIGRVYRGFQLSATLGPMRSIQVFVVGHARQPGTHLLSSASTLVNALFESGGPAATGSLRAIQVKRDGKVVSTIDLYRFIAQGDKSADIRLLSGDVIVIPPAGPRVAILGALVTPAVYELKGQEESLRDVLSYGGGALSTTSPQKIQVERIDSARLGAQRSVETRALDAVGLQSNVRDGDVITLFRISPQFANAVTLRGNVAAPLRYPFRPGMRISDLIPEREALIRPDYYMSKNMMVQFDNGAAVAEKGPSGVVRNLLEEVNWDYAVIERLDAKAVRSQLIPFNLGRAVLSRDTRDDLELVPGDVVTVFGVADVPVPLEKRTQFVRLGGEIQAPGLYQIRPGEKLLQLIARAGGLTSNAFVYGTEFLRESTRRQQQANLDMAVRRFEMDVASANASALQNTSQESDKAASAQAVVASQQQVLSRLRTLKAGGRLALDLDPVNPVLPDIVLEDGDTITVPSPSSFVGVFGAVLSERTFIYREGYLARDYIRRAGLTRFADMDAALIVRADGAVDSDIESANSLLSFGRGVLDRRIFAGDTIFVPEKLDRETPYTRLIRGLKDWTAIFYQFGLGAAGIKTLRQ